MAIYVNDTELENVYFNKTKLDRVYVNNVMVYESTIYIDKPTVEGAYTFNADTQSAIISGYDESQMTISGTLSAKSVGTYHIYFEPKKGYAWKDGTTSKLDYTWTIAKKSIAIPSLSASSFVWVEGNSHSIVVKNLDADYVTQSGTLSQTDTSANLAKANTVTWALKYPSDTKWTDNTNANKSASWSAKWVDGSSHYKNDIYNRGWYVGNGIGLCGTSNSDPKSSISMGGASQPYILWNRASQTSKYEFVYFNSQSYLYKLHWNFEFINGGTAEIRAIPLKLQSSTRCSTYNSYTNSESTVTATSGSVYGSESTYISSSGWIPAFGQASTSAGNVKITRIYHD